MESRRAQALILTRERSHFNSSVSPSRSVLANLPPTPASVDWAPSRLRLSLPHLSDRNDMGSS